LGDRLGKRLIEIFGERLALILGKRMGKVRSIDIG
jgi:hypothetical protein